MAGSDEAAMKALVELFKSCGMDEKMAKYVACQPACDPSLAGTTPPHPPSPASARAVAVC